MAKKTKTYPAEHKILSSWNINKALSRLKKSGITITDGLRKEAQDVFRVRLDEEHMDRAGRISKWLLSKETEHRQSPGTHGKSIKK